MEKIVIEKQSGYENKQRFADVKFLANAASTDETRPYMQVLHAESAAGRLLLAATDGRRLHTVTNSPLIQETGDYRVSLNRADRIILEKLPENGPQSIAFPNWRAVLPADMLWFYGDLSFAKKDCAFERSVYKLNNAGLLFNSLYLKALDIDGALWTAFKNPLYPAVQFISGCRQALIMPMASDSENKAIQEARGIFASAKAEMERKAKAVRAKIASEPAPEAAPVQSASLEDREMAIWHMAEVEAEELAEANAKADFKAHSETEAYEAELSGSEPVTPEPEPEAEAAPIAEKPVQTAADKPIKTPKKPVSRKNAESVQSETGKWMPAGIGKQIYRCKF